FQMEVAEYTVPCAQCSAVDWGISDEGRFYCRACHNVIEVRTTSSSSSDQPVKGLIRCLYVVGPSVERGHVWMICEGFQFILKNQADALLRLGVRPHFKDDVLSLLWRRYLQRSRQAYTHDPVMSYRLRVVSNHEAAVEVPPLKTAFSLLFTIFHFRFLFHGAVESFTDGERSQSLLNMKKMLALIYLALVWSREALTLSDLLRLVNEGHVPYVNAHEQLPEEIKVSGRDAVLFRSETVPSHRSLRKETETLVQFLQLPAFPPIGPQTLLHPALLTLRYLTDANLPDELHPWVCRLMELTGMADETLHTFDPHSHPALPQYDLQAAALIIITMKLFFGIAEQVHLCFEKLTSCPAGIQEVRPSSFSFCWGDEEGSDGPRLHHMKLDGVLTLKDDLLTPLNGRCWHPALRHCRRCRASHYSEVEVMLPRSFVWLLQLFSFMLDVKPSYLYEEVLSVERRIFGTKLCLRKSKRSMAGSRASPRTGRRSGESGGKILM
uniref:TATA box-binding protein-associated factor RNA polymerase I subunit B n=1 Tax=Amphilophus citrinellus TaxID=61819 RepID=A0A3Q0RQD7_AMPCI